MFQAVIMKAATDPAIQPGQADSVGVPCKSNRFSHDVDAALHAPMPTFALCVMGQAFKQLICG